MAKVWLITGASKGFGRVWARAALERGDSVAATARDTSSLGAGERCSAFIAARCVEAHRQAYSET